MKFVILFLSFFSILCQTFGQSNPVHNTDNNNLVEFSEVLEYIRSFNKNPLPQEKVFTITSRNNGYLLLVKSLNECRQISSEKKEFLDYAFKTFGVYEKAKDIFNNEVLIETNAGKFWLPIQDELLKFWTKELKTGDLALIYTRFYGSISNSDDSWILTINSFNAGYYDGLWEEALNCFNNGKDTIGFRCVKKLMSLDPKDGRNYAILAMYYTEKGKDFKNSNYFTKADSLFSIAENLTPQYSYQYFQRAVLKFYIGDYVQSWNYIEKARSLNDEHIESWFLDDLEAKYQYREFKKY